MPLRILLIAIFSVSLWAQAPKAPVTAAKDAAKTATKAATKTAAKAAEPLDLNTATEAQLMQLPGIGDAYSKKIVAARPFARKDELVSKNVIPQATYDKIRDLIIAKQAAGKAKK